MLNHWLYNVIQHWANSAVPVKYELAEEANFPVAFTDMKNIFISTLWLYVYFTVGIILYKFLLILCEEGNF